MPDTTPGDGQVKSDFLATRARAAAGDDQWMRDAAAGQAKPGDGPAPAGAADANGVRTQPVQPDNGASFWSRLKGTWAQMGKDFSAPAQAALGDLKAAVSEPLDEGADTRIGGVDLAEPARLARIAGDVTGYVASPIAGAARATLGPVVEAATGGVIDRAQVGDDASAIAQVALGGPKIAETAAGAPAAAGEADAAAAAAADTGETPTVTPAPGAAPASPAAEGIADPGVAAQPDAAQPAGATKAPFVAGDVLPQSDDLGGGTAAGAKVGPDGAAGAAPVQRDILSLGDEKADPVTISPEIETQAADFLSGKTGDNPVQVNLGYIGSGEAVQDVLERISKSLPQGLAQSNDSTQLVAASLGITPEDFLAGYKGQQLDAGETTAMRFMLDSSAQQLIKYATAASDPATASPAAQAQFVRAFATHRGIQQYFENARAEAGRTLQSYQIMSRATGDQAKAIQALVEQSGGSDTIGALAGRIADLNDPLKASQLVANADKMSGRDLALYGFYNAILSNVPHVLAKKGLSDVSMVLWNTAVRYAAEKMGASGGVAAGETAQLAQGYIGSMSDAIRLAGRGIATGERQVDLGANPMDGIGRDRITVAADGAPPAIGTDQPTRGALDYLKMALPTRWLGAADDFAKYVNYRGELRALAYRDGVGQGLTADALDAHVGQLMDSVPQQMHEQAKAAALRNTFQEPLTGFAAKLQDGADAVNIPLPGTDFKIPLGRMILPFVKIPSNIVATVYRNSPLAAAFPSDAIKSELAQGGATRDLAIARQTLGSGVALAASGVVIAGQLTGQGPSDPALNRAWRAAGNTPYSVTIGGKPYSYNQVDPVGMYLGAIADSIGLMKFAKEQDAANIAASLGFGVGNAMLSKTYMAGIANFLDALQKPDDEASHYVQQFVSSLAVPGAVKAVDTATDPWLHAHNTLLDSIWARTPFASEGLPPLRTLWGDPIPAKDGFLPGLTGTGLARAESPIQVGAPAANAEPIDTWIWDNRAAFPHSDQGKLDLYKPGQTQSWDAPGDRGVSAQIQLQPQELDRLIVQAGNGLKDPQTGLGAKDALNALVQGTFPNPATQAQWDKAAPAKQALMVHTLVNKYRDAAKAQLLTESPRLQDAVQAGWAARQQQLAPQQQQQAPPVDLNALAAHAADAMSAAPAGRGGASIKAPTLGGP